MSTLHKIIEESLQFPSEEIPIWQKKKAKKYLRMHECTYFYKKELENDLRSE